MAPFATGEMHTRDYSHNKTLVDNSTSYADHNFASSHWVEKDLKALEGETKQPEAELRVQQEEDQFDISFNEEGVDVFKQSQILAAKE